MKKKVDKISDSILDKIIILGLLYSVGVPLAILLHLFRALGIIKISHWERFPNYRFKPELYKNGLILVSNHPSLFEPILLPVLFYREYCSHPFRLRPLSTPDKENYYDCWYWHWLLKFVAIPIDRNNQRERSRAFVLIKKNLLSGGIVVLFPEGGRTFKGDEFHYSKEGKRIRILKEGVSLLISKTNALVLPVWIDGAEKVLPNLPDKLYHTFPRFWKRVTIKIGGPLRFQKSDSRELIIQKLVNILLELADEGE